MAKDLRMKEACFLLWQGGFRSTEIAKYLDVTEQTLVNWRAEYSLIHTDDEITTDQKLKESMEMMISKIHKDLKQGKTNFTASQTQKILDTYKELRIINPDVIEEAKKMCEQYMTEVHRAVREGTPVDPKNMPF